MVEVPLLPLDDLALRHGRARGAGEHDRDRDQRPAPREDDEHRGDDRRSLEQRARTAGERRRPAGAGEDDERGGDRTANREGERQCEPEDGGQHDASHLAVEARVERRPHVVEVEEAASEPRHDTTGVPPEAVRETSRHHDGRDDRHAEPGEDRHECERDEGDDPQPTLAWVLEAHPGDGDHRGRKSATPQLAHPSRRAPQRGRHPARSSRPRCRPTAAGAVGRRERRGRRARPRGATTHAGRAGR